MQFIIILLLIVWAEVSLGKTFPVETKLCTYPLDNNDSKILLFNLKTRSQVIINLNGDKVKNLGKGPYLFHLEILNPKYKLKRYEAKIIDFSICEEKEVVRFVDGELRARK